MALCPECNQVIIGRPNKRYCCRECQEKANNRQQNERRRRLGVWRVTNDFEPTNPDSFFEGENERRERLKRKKLNER